MIANATKISAAKAAPGIPARPIRRAQRLCSLPSEWPSLATPLCCPSCRRCRRAPDRPFAYCRDNRQRGIRQARQLALDDRALDLEPDEHKEDRHQPVVNLEQQRFCNGETTDLNRQREIQKLRIECLERRVRQDERDRGGRTKDDAAGRLQLEELRRGDKAFKVEPSPSASRG